MVPVVALVRQSDLDLLKVLLADLPPMPMNATAMRLSGWDDDMVRLGRFIGNVVDLLKAGELSMGTTDR